MATRAISGSACLIYAGDVEVGAAISSGGIESQSVERTNFLGNGYSDEIIPIRREASMTLDLVRWRGTSAKARGLMAQGDTRAILEFAPLTIVVLDVVTEEPTERLTGAVCDRRSWNVDSNGLFGENVSFQGIQMKVEGED